MAGRLLVVDDEPLKRISLQIELSEHGYDVQDAEDAPGALRVLETRPIDVVICDVRMPGMSGLDLLTRIKASYPHTHVILMTAYADVPSAVLAIKRGAHDYITKPFATQELLPLIERLIDSRNGSVAADNGPESFGRFMSRSPRLKKTFTQLRALAASDRPVLFCGESGVGKRTLAEAVHQHSPRAQMPIVRFNIATTAADTLEGDLFGVDKSSGVSRPRPGRVELASHGTLLLEDVDALPPASQAKLLRLIEQRELERSGADQATPVDVRIICTVKRDLLALVKSGSFREDLFYRLNAALIEIPPLRERPTDIPLLAQHVLREQLTLRTNRRVSLSEAAVDELLRHAWPGNVRELEQTIARALLATDGEQVLPQHVVEALSRQPEMASAETNSEIATDFTRSLTDTVSDIERRMILLALRSCNQNQARAAAKLGIPRTTLRDKMARYHLLTNEPDPRPRTETPAAT